MIAFRIGVEFESGAVEVTKFPMKEISLSMHTIYNTLSTSDLNKNDLAAQSNGRLIYFHNKPAHLV